jgi:hypothetical protein
MGNSDTHVDLSGYATGPVGSGALLGLALFAIDWLLLSADQATLGLGLLALGLVLAFWAADEWRAVGRSLSALGAVLLGLTVLTNLLAAFGHAFVHLV